MRPSSSIVAVRESPQLLLRSASLLPAIVQAVASDVIDAFVLSAVVYFALDFLDDVCGNVFASNVRPSMTNAAAVDLNLVAADGCFILSGHRFILILFSRPTLCRSHGINISICRTIAIALCNYFRNYFSPRFSRQPACSRASRIPSAGKHIRFAF